MRIPQHIQGPLVSRHDELRMFLKIQGHDELMSLHAFSNAPQVQQPAGHVLQPHLDVPLQRVGRKITPQRMALDDVENMRSPKDPDPAPVLAREPGIANANNGVSVGDGPGTSAG